MVKYCTTCGLPLISSTLSEDPNGSRSLVVKGHTTFTPPKGVFCLGTDSVPCLKRKIQSLEGELAEAEECIHNHDS